MKVAIDITPLKGDLNGHKVRGVGFYLEYLKRSLLKYYPDNTYHFFARGEKIPSVDLVHYPYFDPFFLTLPLLEKRTRVVTVHDLTPLVFPQHFPSGIKGNLRWQIQKLSLKNTTRIITDSQSSKEDVVQLLGEKSDKINVAYLAAAEEFTQIEKGVRVKAKYNLPEKFVLYVGDVTWNKNLPRLIKAIQEINLTLVMVGKALVEKDFDKTNPWNKDLVEVNKLIENDKRFIRLGFLPTDDLVALYNSATVFAFPSIYEGFGLPVIEAMQCGCPVVTSKGGSLAEVAGEASMSVDPEDISSIANGIGEVFFNRKLQDELSKKGLTQAKKFSWKKTAEDTIASYKKALT